MPNDTPTPPPSPPPVPPSSWPPKLPRTAWIGIAVAGGVFTCAICTCGIGVVVKLGGGNGASEIVGKWESANVLKMTYEFKSDGTGTSQVMDLPSTKFKWSIDNSEKRPILLIDATGEPGLPAFIKKNHYNFVREGKTLSLTYHGIGENKGALVLRKIP